MKPDLKPPSAFSLEGHHYFMVLGGHNAESDSVYLQFNKAGELIPQPILFAYQNKKTRAITISMHYEGLPFEVFAWMIKVIHHEFGAQENIHFQGKAIS